MRSSIWQSAWCLNFRAPKVINFNTQRAPNSIIRSRDQKKRSRDQPGISNIHEEECTRHSSVAVEWCSPQTASPQESVHVTLTWLDIVTWNEQSPREETQQAPRPLWVRLQFPPVRPPYSLQRGGSSLRQSQQQKRRWWTAAAAASSVAV